MSPPRTTSRPDGEPERLAVSSSLPPLLARELASRRDALAFGRPRHAPPAASGGEARPFGAGAVAIAGLAFVICAVIAAVAVLWPREGGGESIVASGVTTTESPFDDVAERGATASTTAPAPAGPGTTGVPTTDEAGAGSTAGAGAGSDEGPGAADDGSAVPTEGSGAPSPDPAGPPGSEAPPATDPGPPATTTTTVPPSAQAPPPPPSGNPADDATWDALAQCESNGNWSADPGNGRYGGLMISDEMWDRYGGDGRPHRHPRETQISIARNIQSSRGWDYWDDCARRLGYR